MKRLITLLLVVAFAPGCNISQALGLAGPDETVSRNGGPDGTLPGSAGPDIGESFRWSMVNPPGLETWNVRVAHRDESGIWALYVGPNDETTIQYLEFATQRWIDWGGAGHIKDITGGGWYLTDRGTNQPEVRHVTEGGTEDTLEGITQGRVSSMLTLTAIATERGSGALHQGTSVLFDDSRLAWVQQHACCPPAWASVINDTPHAIDFPDVWDGLPGDGGGYADAGNRLWLVNGAGWREITGISGSFMDMAFDRENLRAYATADCGLYKIGADLTATRIVPDMGEGMAVPCQSIALTSIDVDHGSIYAPGGKIFDADTGGLQGGWLGIPEIDPGDIEKTQRDVIAHGKAYSPHYLFVDPGANGGMWVYAGPVVEALGSLQPGGWIHVQQASMATWRDPHLSAQQ